MGNRKGFTLVEVICALGVLTLAFLAFTVLVTSASKMNITTFNNKKSFDKGVEDITMVDESKLSEADSSLGIQISGGGTISIPVKIYTTQSVVGDEAVYLEKLTSK